jgi:alpha-tubulin suppressor-like RCC1 family protein
MKITGITLLLCYLFAFRQLTQAAAPAGYVIEWGWNTATGMAAPAKLVLSNTVAISAGRIQCLALKDDGTVNAWSWNRKGEITFDNIVTTGGGGGGGDGEDFIQIPPEVLTNGVVKINDQVLNDIISVAIGSQFGIGLKQDGIVIGWGKNSVPVGPSNVVAIAAASFSSLGVKSDGTVIQWVGVKRFPGHGQFDMVPGLSNVIAVAIGETSQGTRNVALIKDGTVAHWGGESVYNDATPPAGLTNVVAIAAGNSHTLAVKSDGTVIGWGFNDVGQATGVPTTNSQNTAAGQVTIGGQILSNVVSIAANSGYSMALKKDGTVITWGRMVNNLYPATVPEGLSNVVAITAGVNFCLAITTNNAVATKFR